MSSNVIGCDSIVFNQANLIPSANNNQFQFNFPGGRTFKNDKIAIKSISIPYSWKNITAAYGNNVFNILWPNTQLTGTTSSMFTYTVTIPDGNYAFSSTLTQLNTYLQQYCITNGLYLIQSTGGATPTLGSNVYFISCQSNSNYYSVEFDFFPLPLSSAISSDGSGVGVQYKYPANFPTTTSGYTSHFNPLLVVPAATTTNSFSSLIGYAAGTYPTNNPYNATNVNIGVQSTVAPQTTPVQSIIVGCSLASNKNGLNQNVIGTFAYQNTSFGAVILYQPGFAWYSNIVDGSFNSVTLTFWTQSFAPLPIYDPNITTELAVVTTK